MAEEIILFNDGKIARNSDGAILTLDRSLAPASFTVTHDWSGQVRSWVATCSPLTITRNGNNLQYIGTRYQNSGYDGISCTVEIYLVLGSGSVRWKGHFRLAANYTATACAVVDVNIHRNCPNGTISPLGAYTVDSYIQNQPTGNFPASGSITQGSSIVIS